MNSFEKQATEYDDLLKARDGDEIDRRRSLPNGTLVLEQQQKGIAMARTILSATRHSTEKDINYVSNILAATGLNTAWYSFAKDASVQRRRLKLEMLATDEPEQRPTTYMLIDNAISDLSLSLEQGGSIVDSYTVGDPDVERQYKLFGRAIGHAALTLSCAPIGDRIGYDEIQMTDFELQDLARNRGLESLHLARQLGHKLGRDPSLAQLANPDSELSVHWRRHAPNGALEAYELAYYESK